jgi:hypothetical protein
VLATAVAGVAGALAISSSQSTALDVDSRAVALARQLLEEVLARPFDLPASNDQPGWTAGNHNKSSYDNIADFDGYADTVSPAMLLASAPERDLAATRRSYSRAVSFEYRNTPAGAAQANGPMGLITIQVTPVGVGKPFTLHRLATRYTITRD